jgi:hypothetical protein
MNTDNAIKGSIWFFVIIVVGSLLSAFLGGAFGALVAAISPEFVKSLFGADAGESVVRYSFAVGMIWGVFIGAAVAGFACLLAAVIKILRIRFEFKKDQEANKTGGRASKNSRCASVRAGSPGTFNMKSRALPFLVLFGVLALPQHAWANAGTPLMWAGMLHLVYGNALIGLGEGILLAWLFSVPKRKSVTVMVLANYASAWLGGLLIRGAIVQALPMTLTNGWRWFWIMVVATYCMTLALEWPFIAWCLRGTQDWFRQSLRAPLVVQSASYVILFGWYWMASGTSLYTKMDIVASADLSLPESVLVYFISSADGNVYRRQLVDGGEQKIFELHSADRNDRLFVRPSTTESNRWDLVARLETKERRDPRFVEVLTNMMVEAAPDWRSRHTDPPRYQGTWFNDGKAQALGSATNSQWEFWAGFWPVEGLRASEKETGERLHFSYETPFGAWTVRNAVHLPTDKVLFQLGDDQICGFDPVERRVALLWHGRGPVPVIEKGMSNQTVQRTGASRFAQSETRTSSAAGSRR